jgi:hypothetical protein
MPKTQKTPVFEHLFDWRYNTDGTMSPRWDEETRTIPEDRRLVFAHEVLAAIKATGAVLGNNQAANFTKDFLRKKSSNANWPARLAALRWTIEQITGRDEATQLPRNFFFKPYDDGIDVPFPDQYPIPDNAPRHKIQSVTLSVPSKQIGRMDEARMMQIAVALRVVETHFALYSPLSTDLYQIAHMDHLQMGLKLRGSEIDGLYLAEFQDKKSTLHPVLITVEAKNNDELINGSQVIAQVLHASALGVAAEQIVPIALKQGNGGIHILEFAPYEIAEASGFKRDSLDARSLRLTQVVFYGIEPQIAGFNARARRPKAAEGLVRELEPVGATPNADPLDEDEEDDSG